MKGCARSLFLGLAVYLAIAGGIAWLLHLRFSLPLERTWQVSAGAGFFAWVGLTLLFGILEFFRERASIRACLCGQRPADGRQTGIVGTIDAAGPLLRAPLSGTLCLAYKYTISKLVKSGKGSQLATLVEGIALVPSVITTPCGSYRLLAVPTFDAEGESFSREAAAGNAAELLRTARFEPPGKASRGALERQWTDDDGAFQCDRNHTTAEFPLEECVFREDVVKSGEKVYAYGLFSEQRGGLVPHPNWSKETRILRGDVEEVTRKLKRKIRNYAVGGVICCGIAAGILYAFLNHASLI
ncbi:MAG: hypothetical protein WEB59_13690 [Thermoanaerobaculia bacterium]